jgi:hypothetical protein
VEQIVKIFSLSLIKHYTIKTYMGVDMYEYFEAFFTSALDAVEWSALSQGKQLSGATEQERGGRKIRSGD